MYIGNYAQYELCFWTSIIMYRPTSQYLLMGKPDFIWHLHYNSTFAWTYAKRWQQTSSAATEETPSSISVQTLSEAVGYCASLSNTKLTRDVSCAFPPEGGTIATHQNVLKITGSHHGVVYYNSDVELVYDNRLFPFKCNPKSYVICLMLIFGGLLIWNYTSECLENYWVTLGSCTIILICN